MAHIVKKLNCWEVMKCGKGPEVSKANPLGICPVASTISANGLNGGVNGGRICWVIADIHCENKTMCSCIQGASDFFKCEFYNRVKKEEGLHNICRATGFLLRVLEKDK